LGLSPKVLTAASYDGLLRSHGHHPAAATVHLAHFSAAGLGVGAPPVAAPPPVIDLVIAE